MYSGRNREAQQRALERREHEDTAARLRAEVPQLATLKLEMKDGDATMFGAEEHVRHVVVQRAPALFEIRCGDRHCKDGGHDLTHAILRGLRESRVRIEGEDECNGTTGADGAARCVRILKYVAIATYQT
jgi:hypothetical protein